MTMPRLVFPLLACLCFFASRSSPAHGETSPGLHPVVLVPGYTCSNLDARLTDEYRPPPGMPWCGARKGKGWFRLWKNQTAVQDPRLLPCYADQLRLVYDHAADDYRNPPGVQTRVVAFGSTRGFGSDDIGNNCMEKLVTTLEGVGYRDGENMFGAPYDFRYAAAPPGQPSAVFDSDVSRLRRLVEHASRKNGGKPVILVSYAFGGHIALQFLYRSPLPWRRRLVKHYIMLTTGDGGDAAVLKTIASADAGPSKDLLFYANTSRSFASPLAVLPSPRVFGGAPLVVTRDKNYSALDMPEFLADVGFAAGDVAPRYVRRALPVTLGIRAPLVPTTSVVGVGVPTPVRLTYWDGDFGKVPQVVNGDGDGAIRLEVVLAWRKVIDKDPDQGYFKFVLLPNVTHSGILSDDFALKRLLEILAAVNQVTY